jgi:hypothetical protein
MAWHYILDEMISMSRLEWFSVFFCSMKIKKDDTIQSETTGTQLPKLIGK